MQEIDFTNCKKYPKAYGGANGGKKAVIYSDEIYMLKFPPKPKRNKDISYTNSCFSEYISCHILKTLNLEVQDTLLGKFEDKIVVACRDFTENKYNFFDFASLKNSVVDSASGGYDTELSEILYTIDNQAQFNISVEEIRRYFWDMFIADTLLGNFDRHNGNWGFLIDQLTGDCKLSPIFDCGSCLYPQVSEDSFLHIINNADAIESRVYVYPNSAIKDSGVKINMFNFLNNTDNADCLEALKRVSNKIDLKKINEIIDNTPYISDNNKKFLKVMVEARKTLILDEALKNHNKTIDELIGDVNNIKADFNEIFNSDAEGNKISLRKNKR